MARSIRVLSQADVAACLPYKECIEAMDGLFRGLARGEFFQPLRVRVRPDGSPNWMTTMPALRLSEPRLWGLKEMAVNPDNPRAGLDPIQGAVLLHDGHDGQLLAVLNAPAVTSIRTAAVSALATRTFARKGAKTVAIIGAGVQGRAHIAALRCVLPDASYRLWGRTPDKAKQLADELGCEFAPTIEGALAGADVACTVTASIDPITKRGWFAPGCHVNAVGSSGPNNREIDAESMGAASLFVDRRESTINESGDYLGAVREGGIKGPEHIRGELGEVLLGRLPGRTSDAEFTLFKSLGIAIQDLVAAELAVAIAGKHGIGTTAAW